jgi:hypothetical protein
MTRMFGATAMEMENKKVLEHQIKLQALSLEQDS